MHKQLNFLLIFILVFACATPEAKLVSKKNLLAQIDNPKKARPIVTNIKFRSMPITTARYLVEDLLWLQKVDIKNSNGLLEKEISKKLKISGPKVFEKFLHREVTEVVLDEYACHSSEVACTFPQTPGKIYINKKFFHLNRPARVATLLHEAFHFYKDVPHVNCTNPMIENKECDAGLQSSYGIEVMFLQQALLNCRCLPTQLGRVIQRELDLSLLRINAHYSQGQSATARPLL